MPRSLIWRACAALAGIFLISACGGDSPSAPKTPEPSGPAPVASVSVTAPAPSVSVGDTLRLSATVKDAKGNILTGRRVEWSSSDTTRARVDSDGRVTGAAMGPVTISATSEGVRGQSGLEVTRVALASISLSVADTSLRIGETQQLKAVLKDARGNVVTDREITWKSDDPARVPVAADGTIKGIASGPATITATAEGRSASVTVGAYRIGFVTRLGRRFMLDGKPFYVGGANAQQALANKDRSGMESVFANAAQMGVRVLRIWGSSEIGARNGSVVTLGANPDWRPYYQYWDAANGRPAYHDAPNGLQHLDYAVALAKQRGIRLIVSLVDNWDWYWGGANQYVTWYGGSTHGAFYTDARMRKAYKDWVSHLLNRVNSVTGVRYADDPTIMAWGLANEASCHGGEKFPAVSCNRSDVEAWIREMSTFVKSIDSNHLVGVGDIGSFGTRNDAAMGWPYRSTNEPDFETVLGMPNIDYGTYHLYPFDSTEGDKSLSPIEWGRRFIRDREAIANAVGKPALLEEFGARDASVHAAAFDAWLGTLYEVGGAGFTFYEVGGRFRSGAPIWDTAGYSIYPDSPGAPTLMNWVRRFNERRE